MCLCLVGIPLWLLFDWSPSMFVPVSMLGWIMTHPTGLHFIQVLEKWTCVKEIIVAGAATLLALLRDERGILTSYSSEHLFQAFMVCFISCLLFAFPHTPEIHPEEIYGFTFVLRSLPLPCTRWDLLLSTRPNAPQAALLLRTFSMRHLRRSVLLIIVRVVIVVIIKLSGYITVLISRSWLFFFQPQCNSLCRRFVHTLREGRGEGCWWFRDV